MSENPYPQGAQAASIPRQGFGRPFRNSAMIVPGK
jgi:hypothetical protein